MRRNKSQQKALTALNLDLFQLESLTQPAPVTLYTKIREQATALTKVELPVARAEGELPTLDELHRMFDRFNWIHFEGKLPGVSIEYSTRMSSAGSYTPQRRLIRIGRKYHELFPDEIADTLKHEMIHILHIRHDAKFKAEAVRVGASLRAKSHPLLRKPPKYMYVCPHCSREYPRQKRLRMASCGECSIGRRFDKRYKLRPKKTQD